MSEAAKNMAVDTRTALAVEAGHVEHGDAALCLSGGGIRSATFGLGVMQELARLGLLTKFGYLSTVSGGGYIGSWLQARIFHAGFDVARVEDELAGRRGADRTLDRLRAYTNYLTPKLGAASPDTWAAVALYLRNLVLNWVLILPFFLILTLLPIAYQAGVAALANAQTLAYCLLALANFSLMVAISAQWSRLPSMAAGRPSACDATVTVTLAYVLWALLLAASIIVWRKCGASPHWVVIPLVHASVTLMGFEIAGVLAGAQPGDVHREGTWGWLAATVLSGTLLGFGAHWAMGLCLPSWADQVPLVLLPPALLLPALLQTTLFLGMRHETRKADLDREWLARMSGQVLLGGAGWLVLAACTLLLPPLLLLNKTEWNTQWASMTAGSTTVLGALVAWSGKQVWTRVEKSASKATESFFTLDNLLALLGAVFALLLLTLLGGVATSGLDSIAPLERGDWTAAVRLMMAIVSAFALCGWLKLCDHLVNINRFSMHALYRNRLVRAFLGSTRVDRQPDGCTGFDDGDDATPGGRARPGDNLRMVGLLNDGGGENKARPLYPVVNMALNVTDGANPAWSERQAMSFVATPLHCGAADLLANRQCRGTQPKGAFVETAAFGYRDSRRGAWYGGKSTGLSLGTAMTISGAAASPNWGYHSSPLTAFVMTLFNVRLGAWLPNPSTAKDAELQLARPRSALTALFGDLLGTTSSTSQAVNLSDGGHFDNLGLYEMLRRGCTIILVVDAGADETCTLSDLGMALRKAEVDFGVRVSIDTTRLKSRAQIEAAKDGTVIKGVAVGEIDYRNAKDPDLRKKGTGRLIYLKPTYLPDMPTPARAYAQEHAAFPHESTADQWFSESQFESYRTLGQFSLQRAAGSAVGGSGIADLAGLFAAIAARA